jgi:uncharacterized membrane protein YraQ (UPF0718 family)
MLKKISEYFTYTLLKLEHGNHLAYALEFYVYDTIKIFLLLSVITFIVSTIRSFFPPEKTNRILSHKKELIGNIWAALIGVVTPFCLCPAIPLFAGLADAGTSTGYYCNNNKADLNSCRLFV